MNFTKKLYVYSQVNLCSLLYLLREICSCVYTAGRGGDREYVAYGVEMYQLYRQIKCNVIGINI